MLQESAIYQIVQISRLITAVQNYTYDSLNRLKSANEVIGNSQTWKQTFDFDRYGNRKFDPTQTTTIGNCLQNVCNPDLNPANNRVVGHNFDNAGNTTVDAEGRQFFYDAENKQKEVRNAQNQVIGQYLYDGDGKRVKKISANDTTIFVYDAAGKLASEHLITTSNSQAPTTSYLTNDTLGSPRVTTDANGNVTSRRDFRPYGEEIYRAGQGTDKVRQKFTSYERDNETELDFAEARMYSSKLGRFNTVDPIIMARERMIDPQQINLNAYVRNNPTVFIDPDGEKLIVGGNTDEAVSILRKILATSDAEKRITYDAKTGLTVNLKDIDLTKNEGAKLLNDLVESEKNYSFQIDETVESAKGTIVVGDMQNMSNNDERTAVPKPPAGVDGVVVIDLARDDMLSVKKGTNLTKPELWTTSFHELAESYEKVENGKQYTEAHNSARSREETLRDQRPELKTQIYGAGSENLIINGTKLANHRNAVQKKIDEFKEKKN